MDDKSISDLLFLVVFAKYADVLTRWIWLHLVTLCFREPEKRGGEKKATGSTSPPVGSPAPPPAPSSSGSIRSAFLPYAPAFSVLLQCLKMVYT